MPGNNDPTPLAPGPDRGRASWIPDTDVDVTVVGAGVAGCALAYRLTHRG